MRLSGYSIEDIVMPDALLDAGEDAVLDLVVASGCSARSSGSLVPADPPRLQQDCYEAYNIQVSGLEQRLRALNYPKMELGLSGGLDSTHALIVAARTMAREGPPRSHILAVTLEPTGGVRWSALSVLITTSIGAPSRRCSCRLRNRGSTSAASDSSRGCRLRKRAPSWLGPRRRDAVEVCDIEETPFLLSLEVSAMHWPEDPVRSPPLLLNSGVGRAPRCRGMGLTRGDGTSAAVAAGPRARRVFVVEPMFPRSIQRDSG